MSDSSGDQNLKSPAPSWYWVVAILGMVWYVFGVMQYMASHSATTESLMAQGMTAEQASVMLSLPWWMDFSFGIGVFAGLLGSLCLLLRKQMALPFFAASVIFSVILLTGHFTPRIFAVLAIGQVVILIVVITIAIALFMFTRRCITRGWLS